MDKEGRPDVETSRPHTHPPTRLRALHLALECIFLYFFWVVLSGRMDAFHLLMGVACVWLAVILSSDLLYVVVGIGSIRQKSVWLSLLSWYRLPPYFFWLLWSIAKANFQVAYLVLHPRMPIDPVMVRFRTRLDSDISRVILANSITLTPGTVTVDVHEDRFLVHALSGGLAESLVVGDLQQRVGVVFGEQEAMPPDVVMGPEVNRL